MVKSVMSAQGRSAALLAALVVLVVPGGSLVVGGLWLYRYCRSGLKGAVG